MPALHFNLLLAWWWILLGFVSGTALGLGFHRPDWLGGYGSFQRRLLRLAHISFFGLGALNLGFYLTFRSAGSLGPSLQVAAAALAVGALSMPLCCVTMALFPRTRLLFGLPVLSLLLGGVLSLLNLS